MSDQSAAPRLSIGSILQVGLSLIGVGFCALIALGLLLYMLVGNLGGAGAGWDMLDLVWVFSFLALLGLPSLWHAALRLLGKPAGQPRANLFVVTSRAMMALPLILLLGGLVAQTPLSVYIQTPLTILATCIPAWWAVELARWGLGSASAQRDWGALNFALYFSNPLMVAIEITLVVIALIAIGVVIGSSAAYSEEVSWLSEEILSAAGDQARLQELLMPYLTNPLVILAGLLSFSVIIPLLEELIKPLAVWVLVARGAGPAEGLVGGAIAGAGFALAETLFNFTSPLVSNHWFDLIIGRTGTGLLHISTAALVGMGMASAWRMRKPLHLVLAYFGAVTLHGLWNAVSLFSGFAQLIMPMPQLASAATYASYVVMFGLAIVFVNVLYFANRRLRRTAGVPLG